MQRTRSCQRGPERGALRSLTLSIPSCSAQSHGSAAPVSIAASLGASGMPHDFRSSENATFRSVLLMSSLCRSERVYGQGAGACRRRQRQRAFSGPCQGRNAAPPGVVRSSSASLAACARSSGRTLTFFVAELDRSVDFVCRRSSVYSLAHRGLSVHTLGNRFRIDCLFLLLASGRSNRTRRLVLSAPASLPHLRAEASRRIFFVF